RRRARRRLHGRAALHRRRAHLRAAADPLHRRPPGDAVNGLRERAARVGVRAAYVAALVSCVVIPIGAVWVLASPPTAAVLPVAGRISGVLLLCATAMPLVGALILRRQPRNAMGLIYAGAGTGIAMQIAFGYPADNVFAGGAAPFPGDRWAA